MNTPPTQFQKTPRTFVAVSLSTTRNAFAGHFAQLSIGVVSTRRLVRFASSAAGYAATTIARSALDSRRPFGNAKSKWMNVASGSAATDIPSVYSSDEFVAESAPRNQTKPTMTISEPVRLFGLRAHANSPLPMNDQPSRSARR